MLTHWVKLVEETLWHIVDQTFGHRTVVGLRGAYPAPLIGTATSRISSMIHLSCCGGTKMGNCTFENFLSQRAWLSKFWSQLEFILKPNRRPYTNLLAPGLQRLRMALPSYPVQDDTNNNGHWDSDRNGWRNGGPADRERLGNAHNIHMSSSDSIGRVSN